MSRKLRPGRRRGWRPERVVPIVVLAVLLIAAGTAAFAATSATGPRARVPNLVGMGQQAARGAADRARVGVRFRTVPSDDPAGTVVTQDPAPGTLLAAHHAVTLRLSAGPPPVDLPGVAGKTEVAARNALDAAGFVVTTEHRTDETVTAGLVEAQQPADRQGPPGSEVHLVISDGPAPVEVPNVVGESRSAAETAITSAGLEVGAVATQPAAGQTAGNVISQTPGGGTLVATGASVKLTVAQPSNQVAVPGVVGREEARAAATLGGAGFVPHIVSAVTTDATRRRRRSAVRR